MRKQKRMMGIYDVPNLHVSLGIIFCFVGIPFCCATGIYGLRRIRIAAIKEQLEWLSRV